MIGIDGVRIIESMAMVRTVEDWSRVRSKPRALRRRAKHRQNIRWITVPRTDAVSLDGGRTMIMHPAVAQQLRALIREAS